MSSNVLKFQNLTPDTTYAVMEYSDPFKTQYGISYMLTIRNEETKEQYEIWSTKLLANYIKEQKPSKVFRFEVKVNKESKLYPHIHGYEQFKRHILSSDDF